MFQKSVIFIATILVTVSYTSAKTDKIVCFYANWAVYREGLGKFTPDNIDASLCTHVHYAFLGVNPDGTIKILDPWCDINLGGFAKTAALKEINPNLKTLITIGGYNAGHAILDGIAASSKLRQNLILSAMEFCTQYGFDGLDIDWMYPAISDKANFVTLLQEMKAAFEENGDFILSVTASANPLSSYDIPAITKIADLINLVTYDYHTPYEGVTGYNAPLYGPASVNSSVAAWLARGVDAEKLTFSVAFYGHTYSLANPNNHGVNAPATAGIGGPYTKNPGSLGFNELSEFYSDWERVWDDGAKVPYSFSGANWASFDDVESIGLKAKFAKEQGLAGVAIWSVDTDDFRGATGTSYALLRAIKENF